MTLFNMPTFANFIILHMRKRIRDCLMCAFVCLICAYMCHVFTRTLHVLVKPWGGIIANFSPRTQSLPFALSLSIHGSPTILCKCRGSHSDKMRADVYRPWWGQHCHQPRLPLPSSDESAVIVFVCALGCNSSAHASSFVNACV